MALHRLALDLPDRAPPEAVRQLIQRAWQLGEEFMERQLSQPGSGFLASDYELAWSALSAVLDSGRLCGRRFCEWGSGVGTVTLMAAHLGFEARGVEIQEALVEVARRLQAESGLAAGFSCGDFAEAPAADLVYAFPWPGEEARVRDHFERTSQPGALLLTYEDAEDLLLLCRE